VYVTGGRQDCASATLAYRVGAGAEQRARVDRFPCEFSVRLPAGAEPVTWRVER
jgi:hypothetical protein